jgi:bifunctional polynucleotide phosphatase/kinase
LFLWSDGLLLVKAPLPKKQLGSKGYAVVNLDTMKTHDKCLKEMRIALTRGVNVVVDNTNPDRAARKRYIDVAISLKARVRCFHMSTPRAVAEHLNHVRVVSTRGETHRIPDIAYNTFNKRFELPDLSEGFADVCTVNFVPEFSTEKDRRLFLHWTDD